MEKGKNPRKSESRLNVLEFERPILELDERIEELEALRASTNMDLAPEIKPLRERRKSLIEEIYSGLSPWERVLVARHPDRPLTTDYINGMLDDFVELHGDRAFADDKAMVAGLARIEDQRFLLIGHRKGKGTSQRLECNFGSAHPEGYRKALQKMKLAEKYRLPVVSLINTPGAYPGVGAEERGQASAIAVNILEMSRLRTPILGIVTGEGGSGGALGIGVCDRLMMLENSYYSVISPEGCAAILWRDGANAQRAAEALKLTSGDLRSLGIIDQIVPEPLGGAHRSPREMILTLKSQVLATLKELGGIPLETLLETRFERLRTVGSPTANSPAS